MESSAIRIAQRKAGILANSGSKGSRCKREGDSQDGSGGEHAQLKRLAKRTSSWRTSVRLTSSSRNPENRRWRNSWAFP